ncbi:DUF4129 domain-containing protein [Arthrobacter sp. VKM Ac-2550]|uniref:DUF4129 domain-containing protein n=1 Tax=Crystallibacter permensis TaxID=1938888 RepID=UPI0022263D15|nr:DUF4129 domain-containing protein [Arthrobacter sp. VKM Ac-2550]MCW2132759.1 protein of unknown function (DUF4129) [Arthrobacter sp. VKM Ac-2550]
MIAGYLSVPPVFALLPAPAAVPPVTPGEDEARELLIRELAKEPYQEARPGLLERMLTAVSDWFTDLIESLEGVNPNLGTALIVLAAVLVIGAAIWLVRPRLNARKRGAAEVFDGAARLSAAEHRQRAAAAAASQEWNTAVAEEFRALVRAMEERVILQPQPGQTADEAAASIAPAFPGHAAEVRRSAALFDGVRYGNVPASEQDYNAVHSLFGALAGTSPVFGPRAPSDLAVPR